MRSCLLIFTPGINGKSFDLDESSISSNGDIFLSLRPTQGLAGGRGWGRGGERFRVGRGSGDLGSDSDSKGGDEGGAGERPRGEMAAALERMYSMPATEKRRQISEGLGRAAPTPRQRVRLQREGLEMK